MIRRDAVDGAVDEALDQRLAIVLRAQGRIHLETRRVGVAVDDVLGEQQVVGGHLGGHLHAARLRAADLLHRLAGGHVADVDAGVLVSGERAVAGHLHGLGHAGDAGEPDACRHDALVHHAVPGQAHVLLVKGEQQPRGALVLQRAAHHQGTRHRHAVVGQRSRAGLRQVAVLGEGIALLPHRDGRDEPRGHHGLLRRPLQKRPEDARVVGGRLGVGHGEHGDHPARGRTGGTGRDVLGVLLARGAQVHVHVHDAGDHREARGVNLLETPGVTADHAVTHDEVADGIDARGRVEQPCTPQHHVGRVAGPLRQPHPGVRPRRRRHAASRTAPPSAAASVRTS